MGVYTPFGGTPEGDGDGESSEVNPRFTGVTKDAMLRALSELDE